MWKILTIRKLKDSHEYLLDVVLFAPVGHDARHVTDPHNTNHHRRNIPWSQTHMNNHLLKLKVSLWGEMDQLCANDVTETDLVQK